MNACDMYQDVWEALLPQGVSTCGGLCDINMPDLDLIESKSFGYVGQKRGTELRAGRYYAKQAALKLGVTINSLPKKENSAAPNWPAGIVGSISHCPSSGSTYAVAAVAKQCDIGLLGIDVEQDDIIQPAIWPQFMLAEELDMILGHPVDVRFYLANLIWAIKESAIKASAIEDRDLLLIKSFDYNPISSFRIKLLDQSNTYLNGYACRFKQHVFSVAYAQ